MSEESLNFDLTPVTVPVCIGGKNYLLHEASGEAATIFNNARSDSYIYTDGKLSKVNHPADLEPLLVSLCLKDDAGNSVPKEVILKWPSRIQTKLFIKAKTISEMDISDDPKEIEQQIEKLQKILAEIKGKNASKK